MGLDCIKTKGKLSEISPAISLFFNVSRESQRVSSGIGMWRVLQDAMVAGDRKGHWDCHCSLQGDNGATTGAGSCKGEVDLDGRDCCSVGMTLGFFRGSELVGAADVLGVGLE